MLPPHLPSYFDQIHQNFSELKDQTTYKTSHDFGQDNYAVKKKINKMKLKLLKWREKENESLFNWSNCTYARCLNIFLITKTGTAKQSAAPLHKIWTVYSCVVPKDSAHLVSESNMVSYPVTIYIFSTVLSLCRYRWVCSVFSACLSL